MAHLAATAPLTAEPVAVLDPGSGPGTLLEAFLNEVSKATVTRITATAVERDPILALDASTLGCPDGVELTVLNEDFFEFYRRSGGGYSHVVMNPPYGRPARGSEEQQRLKKLGLPAHNLYAAFTKAAFDLLRDEGLMVAIVPRSILTGTMASSLRTHILAHGKLEFVTTFVSRKLAFTRDDVKQDVVIIGFRKSALRLPSSGATVRVGSVESVAPWRCTERLLAYDDIVRGAAESPYLCVPNDSTPAPGTAPILSDGLAVSTGPVVDFRLQDFIANYSSANHVPLIDARNKRESRRYLKLSPRVQRHIFPPGIYVALDRFSPPEQTPRLSARIVDATRETGVAFENHVNFIHRNGRPLDRDEADGIVHLFRHPAVDAQLSELSSSTHINAIDIRRLRRPL